MPLIRVDDLADPRLNDYRNVPDPDLLHARGVFVAEGRHVVRRLLTASRFPARSLLVTDAAISSVADVLPAFPDVPVYVVAQQVMNAVTGFNIHRGCLAIGERVTPAPWVDAARDARIVLVLERIANADNVGGIFRNAAAFGAGAVLLGPACTDPLYRKALRTSMGATLRVPFASLEDWPADLARLRAAGFRLVALTPASDAMPLRECTRRAQGSPAALLVGHEGEGLSEDALRAADLRARIPMAAGNDSLNVASAAAIALYELSLNQGAAGSRKQGKGPNPEAHLSRHS